MELAKYKACICEGAAENAIMDILLDEELLVFSREEMLEESVIRCMWQIVYNDITTTKNQFTLFCQFIRLSRWHSI